MGREAITLQRTSKQNLKRDRNKLSKQGEYCIQVRGGHGLCESHRLGTRVEEEELERIARARAQKV